MCMTISLLKKKGCSNLELYRCLWREIDRGECSNSRLNLILLITRIISRFTVLIVEPPDLRCLLTMADL